MRIEPHLYFERQDSASRAPRAINGIWNPFELGHPGVPCVIVYRDTTPGEFRVHTPQPLKWLSVHVRLHED